MRIFKTLRAIAVTLACVGMLAPTLNAADAVRDIALQRGGVLNGFAVDQQGAPRAGVNVHCLAKGQLVAKTKTDKQGKFAFTNLRGGVYEIKSELGGGVFRAWAARTAPPAAKNGVLLVDGSVVRGQKGKGGGGGAHHHVLRVLSNPWVIGGAVAAAIAIPLALDDDGS